MGSSGQRSDKPQIKNSAWSDSCLSGTKRCGPSDVGSRPRVALNLGSRPDVATLHFVRDRLQPLRLQLSLPRPHSRDSAATMGCARNPFASRISYEW